MHTDFFNEMVIQTDWCLTAYRTHKRESNNFLLLVKYVISCILKICPMKIGNIFIKLFREYFSLYVNYFPSCQSIFFVLFLFSQPIDLIIRYQDNWPPPLIVGIIKPNLFHTISKHTMIIKELGLKSRFLRQLEIGFNSLGFCINDRQCLF